MNKTIGIFAHVDAGKTTLSEQVLFRAGAIRAPGRVDHQSAFLDAHPIERARGITVFSDQASFEMGCDTYDLLDTPGHVDFSPEMERAISVIDYAVLLISCAEGVQSHTETVWHLLNARNVPVFIFLNKIDRAGADRDAVMGEIRERLSSDAVFLDGYPSDFPPALREAVAERDESLLDLYLDGKYDEALWQKALIRQIRSRALIPVFSGAALTGLSIDSFLEALSRLTITDYHQKTAAPFSARVYKVRHDPQGARVCFLKVLTGRIGVREELSGVRITELRRYHGARYKSVLYAEAGELCAAVGIPDARPGDILGEGACRDAEFSSEPMLRASVIHPPALRSDDVVRALREIEDEEPTLSVSVDASGISISVMGEVQLEVLAQLLRDRYQMDISFGKKRVLYQETILAPAVGIGHFEPLRHYAEVHLRLVPGAPGSGICFESFCHVDKLALSWQRLIETHVFEKRHRGVLIGAPLTDVAVQLLIGRAHLKHTEGGDFREATYRAIRNALMNAESALLEPWCSFRLRAPADLYGRIMGDLTRMRARCDPPEYARDMFALSGSASFREISGYGMPLTALTHGLGSISYRLSHYERARDEDEIVAASGYDPERDDSPDSVFCSKGAGFTVHWREVPEYAHCPREYKLNDRMM